MIHINKSAAFPFEDRYWKEKIPVGGLLEIVPIANFWAAGYWIEVMRIISSGKYYLPEWDNWGSRFVDGFKSYLIRVLYFIPSLILFCIAWLLFNQSSSLSAFVVLAFGFYFWVVATFLLPMGVVHFAVHRKILAAFYFKSILGKIRENFDSYMLALIVFLITIPLTFFLIIFIPFALIHPFVFFYLEIVFASLFARTYIGNENS